MATRWISGVDIAAPTGLAVIATVDNIDHHCQSARAGRLARSMIDAVIASYCEMLENFG